MIDRVLGDPTRCRVFSPDVAVHWFPSFDDGSPCYCGERAYHAEEDEDAARRPDPGDDGAGEG